MARSKKNKKSLLDEYFACFARTSVPARKKRK